MNLRTKAISLLQELMDAHSVPVQEDEVRAIIVDELEESGDLPPIATARFSAKWLDPAPTS